MTFDDLLKPHLPGLPAILPAEIRQATILVRHSPDAVSRDIPTRVAEAVEERLRDALPMLRAGFAAVAPGSGRELSLNVLPIQDGYAIEMTDAAHTFKNLVVTALVVLCLDCPIGTSGNRCYR